jgi:hypothetical protein
MKSPDQNDLNILYKALISLYDKIEDLEDYNDKVVLSEEEASNLYFAGLNVIAKVEESKQKRFKRLFSGK